MLPQSVLTFAWTREKRSHLALFALVLVLLPVNYAVLELPASIINGITAGLSASPPPMTLFDIGLDMPGLFGGGSIALFPGWPVGAGTYLTVTCAILLALMLIQFQIGYFIDIGRVLIEERLTRSIRETIFGVLIRLRPDAQVRLSGDMTNFLRSNLRSVGGFAASAFVAPLRAGGLVATALLLIFHQNAWLALVAVVILLVDAWFFRTQLGGHVRLIRERQKAGDAYVTGLAATAERIATVRAYGLTGYERGEIGARIARLFEATVAVHRDRATMRLLQSLFLQTPALIFFLVGGLLALAGQLDVGQLVAVVAAYQQIPDPLKELLDWDEKRAEAQVRYDTVVRLSREPDVVPDGGARPDGDFDGSLSVNRLTVADPTGHRLLDAVTLSIPKGRTVLLTGAAPDGRDALVQVLAGALDRSGDAVQLGADPLSALPETVRASRLIVVEDEGIVLPATLRDNVGYALRRGPDGVGDAAILHALDRVGLSPDLVGWALDQPLDRSRHGRLVTGLADLRRQVGDALRAPGLADLVEPFDPARFLRWATLGENIAFGLAPPPEGPGALQDAIEATGTGTRLDAVGAAVVANARSLGGVAGFEDVLARRGLVDADLLSMLDRPDLAPAARRRRHIVIAWRYCEARHRLGLVDQTLEASILASRTRLAAVPLPGRFDVAQAAETLTVRDNLLFGRAIEDRAGARARVADAIGRVLTERGLADLLTAAALDVRLVAGTGPGALSRRQRAQLALARGLVADPAILIVGEAAQHLPPAMRPSVMGDIMAARAGRTTILSADEAPAGLSFDITLRLADGRLAGDTP